MKQNQFKFKPFDCVLVRDNNQHVWNANIYSHSEQVRDLNNNLTTAYVCIDSVYRYCIPYNEETAHLLGTNKPYQPKEKEIKYEVTYDFGNNSTVVSYTEEEFKNFINVAICNNKDVKDFSVNIIIPD